MNKTNENRDNKIYKIQQEVIQFLSYGKKVSSQECEYIKKCLLEAYLAGVLDTLEEDKKI